MDCYILGLLLGVIGVFLLGYFGLPTTYLELHVVEWGLEGRQKIIRIVFSWIGIVLTLIGFIMQIRAR